MTTEKAINPNTNCLVNMACPKCGSFGGFKIHATCSGEVLVCDDGTDEIRGDIEWTGASICTCIDCGHAATVEAFTDPEALAAQRQAEAQSGLVKLCPFCGSTAGHTLAIPRAGVLDAVSCNDLRGADCYASIEGSLTPYSALIQWNRRT